MSSSLMRFREIRRHFPIKDGVFVRREVGSVRAVDGVSFDIEHGKTFGLVGESGCGKSTIARLALLLDHVTDGSITYDGTDVREFSSAELRKFRHSVQAVFQDPYSSLSPRLTAGAIIAEPLVVARTLSRSAIRERVAELLETVGLPRGAEDRYPHEFSGGQRQRIAIARALAVNPRLIILDEPVSALDVSIRAQIMNLLKDIQREFGIAYLLIAHDIEVVKHMSDRTGVMYLGKLVEVADGDDLYLEPRHPYTNALMAAVPPSHPDQEQSGDLLPGDVPSPVTPPKGCSLHPRCPLAEKRCAVERPELKQVAPNHLVGCHLF
ncbi:MAG: ATP-binding cassette domain-containing protein [Rhizobiaceae bacterium]